MITLTRSLEITIRDMYSGETDTVILSGSMARRFTSTLYKSDFLLRLETVYFDSPYVVNVKKI